VQHFAINPTYAFCNKGCSICNICKCTQIVIMSHPNCNEFFQMMLMWSSFLKVPICVQEKVVQKLNFLTQLQGINFFFICKCSFVFYCFLLFLFSTCCFSHSLLFRMITFISHMLDCIMIGISFVNLSFIPCIHIVSMYCFRLEFIDYG